MNIKKDIKTVITNLFMVTVGGVLLAWFLYVGVVILNVDKEEYAKTYYFTHAAAINTGEGGRTACIWIEGTHKVDVYGTDSLIVLLDKDTTDVLTIVARGQHGTYGAMSKASGMLALVEFNTELVIVDMVRGGAAILTNNPRLDFPKACKNKDGLIPMK